MRKLFPFLLILIFLAVLATYFLSKPKTDSTITEAQKAFAIKDTSEIGEIQIDNKAFAKLKLSRAEDGWWHVNDKWLARPDKIDLILQTLYRIRADKPVANVAKEKITASMKDATKIKIFDKEGNIMKSYLMSGSNSKRTGNHMRLADAEQIFLVKLPGFDGYFSPRFMPRLADWRLPRVFNYGPENIAELTVEYPDKPQDSFSIKREGEEFNFNRLSSPHPKDSEVKQNVIRGYLKGYRNLNAEAFENEYEKQDSLKAAKPYIKVSLTDIHGQKADAEIYRRKVYRRTKVSTEEDGTVRKYDIDRYFAFIHDRRDFVIIQDYVFGPIFRRHNEFLPKQ